MKTYTATVENGVVRLPSGTPVRDGAKVVLAVLGDSPQDLDPQTLSDLEAEDLAFVRACRGRLARHMQAEDE